MKNPITKPAGFITGLSFSRGRQKRSVTVDRRPTEAINPDHVESVERGIEQARRDQYASDGEMNAIYRLAGL